MTVYKAKAKFVNTQPRFKIFYENGTTYDNTSGPLDRAHKCGVVAIIVEENNGQRIESDHEFYCYMPDGWRGVEQWGLYDYLSSPGTKLVLFGRVTSKRNEIINAAMNDTYLKAK